MELAAKFGRLRKRCSSTHLRGAYPGIDAERAQGCGRPSLTATCARWRGFLFPSFVTVTGEGGSGGALVIAVGDYVNILENSFYSVISPEGCAAIMWRELHRAAKTAAIAMKIMSTGPEGPGHRRRNHPRTRRRRP